MGCHIQYEWLRDLNSIEFNASCILWGNSLILSMCYDGRYLWSAQSSGGLVSFNPSAPTTSVNPYPLGTGLPICVCFDGTSIWCSTTVGVLGQYTTNGTYLGGVTGIGALINRCIFDGKYLWCINVGDVYRVSPITSDHHRIYG